MSTNLTILCGNALEQLRPLPDESVQMCVTSPPYWGLRDYGTGTWKVGDPACSHKGRSQTSGASTLKNWKKGGGTRFKEQSGGMPISACKCGAVRIDDQLGLEATPELYVERLCEILMEVHRVLKKDGTLWLNLGDCYAGGGRCTSHGGLLDASQRSDPGKNLRKRNAHQDGRTKYAGRKSVPSGLKQKDLIGIPWMVAFALRSRGWYLRSEITWCKKVPLPESVQDRPTSATEKVFLLSKSAKYYYDIEAVRNPPSESYAKDKRHETGPTPNNAKNGYDEAGAQNPKQIHSVFKRHGIERTSGHYKDIKERCAEIQGSNMRNFWVLAPSPYLEAHFATFPPEVPLRCILAGSRAGDTVIDPFGGSGTTAAVALDQGRRAIIIELNPDYIPLIRSRTALVTFPLDLKEDLTTPKRLCNVNGHALPEAEFLLP